MAGNKVVLVGIEQTVSALKKFDVDAVKRFQKTINDELKIAKIEAQGLIDDKPPMSGWRTVPATNGRVRGGAGWPAWDGAAIRAGIKTSRAKGKVRKGDYTTSAGALLNTTGAGVIFEVAGRSKGKSSVSEKGGSGEQFKRTLSNRFGPASRVVWKIVDAKKGSIERKFQDALNQAKSDLQQALDSSK